MNQAAFPWILLSLTGLGLYLLIWQGLALIADLLGGLVNLVRRRFQPVALQRLKELQELAGVQASHEGTTRNKALLTLAGLSQ